MNPTTSIILRTYNEEESIKKCLSSVFSQTLKNFEAIIIDSGSTDKTLEIAKKFRVKIIEIDKQRFSYGRLLNIGCREAKGKYLVFISAHAIPAGEDWLKNLIKNLNDRNIAGVYGKQIPAKNCNPLTKRQMLAHWKNTKKTQTKDPFFSNANSVIKKEIWEEAKFNETLPGSEDHEWAKRVQKQGYSILYEPNATIIHSHNENFKQIFNRNYRETYSNLLIYDRKLAIRYLIDNIYNFYQDSIYVLKNKHHLYWIIKSFINNFLSFIATFLAFLRALNINKNKIIE